MWQAVLWVLRPMTTLLGCTGHVKVFLYRVTSSRGSLFINLFLCIQHALKTFVFGMPFITVGKLLLFHDCTDIQCMYQFCGCLCHVPACWRKAFTTDFLTTVSKNLMLTVAHQTKMCGPWPMANAHSSQCCIACCKSHSSLLSTWMCHLYKLPAGGCRSVSHTLSLYSTHLCLHMQKLRYQ